MEEKNTKNWYCFRLDVISTLTNSFKLELKSVHLAPIEAFTDDFLAPLILRDQSGQSYFNVIQRYSIELQNKINELVEKYKECWPELNGFKSQLKTMPNDKFICFLPVDFLTETFDRQKTVNLLESLNSGISLDDIEKRDKEIVGNLKEVYSLRTFGYHRLRVGNQERAKRVCRFCEKSAPEVSFKKKAHAISESLGNKKLVLLDECDNCNSKFSKTIEPDIVRYLSLFRTAFKINAKGGVKGIREKEFTIQNDTELKITLNNSPRPIDSSLPYDIVLNYGEKLSSQNIYKCLCKFFLSLIPEEDLKHFSQTAKWIRGQFISSTLPLVAELIDYKTFTREPVLLVFKRKWPNKMLPLAFGEFRFTCLRIFFILPFADDNSVDFALKENFDTFWNSVDYLQKLESALFIDHSNDTPRNFTIKLAPQLKKDENK